MTIHQYNQAQGYFFHAQLSWDKNYPAHNVKMPRIVGIFTFTSKINDWLYWFNLENYFYILNYFDTNEGL